MIAAHSSMPTGQGQALQISALRIACTTRGTLTVFAQTPAVALTAHTFLHAMLSPRRMEGQVTLEKTLLVVGAGFTGAVVARRMAEAGHRAIVIDARDHVAGNCHTARDPQTGIMVHVHGPHIFHTDDAGVWDFINAHARMMPYRHQVKAQVGGQVYSMPINLHTINQFFGRAMSPAQAQALIAEQALTGPAPPRSFEDQALRMMGRPIYEAFFRGYTQKQWGVAPDRLPASILKRLPMRFTYDDNYFFHLYQGIPRDGYTAAVASILDHPRIALVLNTRAEDFGTDGVDHIVYTGPLDRYFGHRLGRLSYRTLDFDHRIVDAPHQGTAVMNYCDSDIPQTRVTEHMYFAPWEAGTRAQSLVSYEYSRAAGPEDTPYYPLRLLDDKALLRQYEGLARATPGVTFAGRLGSYAYLDMDVAIRRAMDVADHLSCAFARRQAPEAFVHPV